MIKTYIIEADDKDNPTVKLHLNLEQKKKEVLKGIQELIHMNEIFEIQKCKLPYEIKLVLINREDKLRFKIIESTASNPSKQELKRFIVEFNTCLKMEKIPFSVDDKNNYQE